jgi:Arc/MetJ family transcription regulator
MRTNIVLDDALVRRAMKLTGARTKREVVHVALSHLVESRSRKNLLELAGTLDFRPDFDHKALRGPRGDGGHADR